MNKQLFLLSFIVAAIATLAVGCQKEEGTVTLGAKIQKPINGNAKVYIDDHTPCWHNADEVYINNAVYPVMAASGSSARIENVVSSSAYRAIFPAGIVPTGSDISSSSSVPVTLPSVQHYELVNGHQRVDVPMGAYITSGSTLQFYNLCSVVRVIVSNSLNQELPLRRIVLHADDAMLSGAGTATISGESSNSITLSSTASHEVSLDFTGDCPASVAALGSSTFDIVVPAFVTDDVTITLYTADGQYCELTKENVALSHNTITTVTQNVTGLTNAPHAELVDGNTFCQALPEGLSSVVFEYFSNVSSGTLLSTADSPVPIYGNYSSSGTYRVSTSASVINANPNCSYMFYVELFWEYQESPSLRTIDFGEGFNTSNVTNMSKMFMGNAILRNLDLSSFNTSNVTNMSYMFCNCDGLTSLNLSNFNTSNVTNMEYMFFGCNNLTSLDLSNFNTSNVTNLNAMFDGCSSLTGLNLSNFNTTSVTNMTNMFHRCSGLTSLNVSNFITSSVTSMAGMFDGCSGLTNLNVSNFNTTSVTSMGSMFNGCSGLTSLNLSNFNTSNVTYMSNMFSNCSSLTSLVLSSFTTSNVEYMEYMFNGCSRLTSLDLSSFNTLSVRRMGYMFSDCSRLTSLNLSNFNMRNVTNSTNMCRNLSIIPGYCTITCPSSVESYLRYYGLPSSVSFTWVRP